MCLYGVVYTWTLLGIICQHWSVYSKQLWWQWSMKSVPCIVYTATECIETCRLWYADCYASNVILHGTVPIYIITVCSITLSHPLSPPPRPRCRLVSALPEVVTCMTQCPMNLVTKSLPQSRRDSTLAVVRRPLYCSHMCVHQQHTTPL